MIEQSPQVVFPFVVGSVRSGTTMLRLMLNNHPDLAIPPETYFPVELWPYRKRYGGETEGGFNMSLLTQDLLENPYFPDFRENWGLELEWVKAELPTRTAGDYPDGIRRVYELYAERHGKARYGNKTPWFVRHLELLNELFPEARFIHLVRDGRDVVMSMLDQSWGPSRLSDAARLWANLVTEGRAAGLSLPGRYLEINYEQLVADPTLTLRRICDFIELDFHPKMLRYFEGAMSHLPERVHHLDARLAQPPSPSLRDWRREMSARDLAVVEAIAGESLVEFGYERAFPKTPARARLRAASGEILSTLEANKKRSAIAAKKLRARMKKVARKAVGTAASSR